MLAGEQARILGVFQKRTDLELAWRLLSDLAKAVSALAEIKIKIKIKIKINVKNITFYTG
jgi:hypothetical protein